MGQWFSAGEDSAPRGHLQAVLTDAVVTAEERTAWRHLAAAAGRAHATQSPISKQDSAKARGGEAGWRAEAVCGRLSGGERHGQLCRAKAALDAEEKGLGLPLPVGQERDVRGPEQSE